VCEPYNPGADDPEIRDLFGDRPFSPNVGREEAGLRGGARMSAVRKSTEVRLTMTEDVQLAALAVIELVARQIVDPGQAQEHRDELAVILADVDPTWVALEIATVLAGVVTGTGFPIGALIEAKRAQLLAT
jgi:hypothetical protein